jgi:alpha,alpha-trehalose phosphorylase
MLNHAEIEAHAMRDSIAAGVSAPSAADDPRLAKSFKDEVLVLEEMTTDETRVVMGYRTRSSGMTLGCGMDHVVETTNDYTATTTRNGKSGQVVFNVRAEPNQPFVLYKYLTYHTSHSEPPSELRARSHRTLDRAVRDGFRRLLEDQEKFVKDFWRRSDIEISVPQINPRLQQCLRWNLYQLLQATAASKTPASPPRV